MQVSNDKKINIAVGTGRKAKTWKNKQVLWSDVLDKLSQPVRTNETVAQYKAMSRDRQSEIKDVGGFVGGYCEQGDRKRVKHRSLVTLDADYADANLWDDWGMIYGNAAAIYSTHKHTPEAMRLRLVIPLSRDVDPDEYAAISRRIAADLGIDKFDDTTYQAQRLMYWPSCSKDGDYVFEHCDGPIIDADAVLGQYVDWHDMSSWPMSSRVANVIRKTADKQQDPLEKKGIVGAFCRTYTITEAIETFVPDYEKCDEDNRYTYTGGSTAAGVVVYDDKFSYSHHATDPASGQLCNAWDLVRVHRFGDLDDQKDEDTTPTKLPSYKAMQEFAMADENVRVALVNERLSEIGDDFSDLEDEVKEELKKEDTKWKRQLSLTESGGIRSSIENIAIILENDPGLRGAIAYDEMDMMVAVKRDLPWRKARDRRGQTWQNSDDSNLRLYLERYYGISGKEKIADGVEAVAHKHCFHPVRDYLNSCEWDGKPRLDTLLVRYLGAEDSAYTRAVTRKTFVAAVARVFVPGIKFDYMLTIRGTQGIGKSSLIGRLAGKWFSDSFTAVSGKEAFEQIRRAWIIEIGELAGMKKAEVEAVKLFISKQEDQYRPAYGRNIETFPRQCIFIGTTNEREFLRDTTGNRRYWVVDTPNSASRDDFRTELTPEIVKQIWAEAMQRWKDKEPLTLTAELEEKAAKVQREYAETDDRAGMVVEYLNKKLPEGWDDMDLYDRRDWLQSGAVGMVERTKVCRMEIWCEVFGNPVNKIDRLESKAIAAILESAGWHYGDLSRFPIYGHQRTYTLLTK